MKLRQNCNCICHESDVHIIHMYQCCTPMPTMEEGWEIYRDKCIPPDIDNIAIQVLKVAYYAGASQVGFYFANVISELEDFDKKQVEESLKKECLEFFKDFINGPH